MAVYQGYSSKLLVVLYHLLLQTSNPKHVLAQIIQFSSCGILVRRSVHRLHLETYLVFLFALYPGSNLPSFASCAVDGNDEWEISRDLLVIGQKIGEGQFGLVLEGTLMTGGCHGMERERNYG